MSIPGLLPLNKLPSLAASNPLLLPNGTKPVMGAVTVLADNSRSMSRLAPVVHAAYNEQVTSYRALAQSHPNITLRIRTEFLNAAPLHGFVDPFQAQFMDLRNYVIAPGTPLFRRSADVLEETEHFAALHVSTHSVQTYTYLMTDGAPTERNGLARVRRIIERMLAAQNHIIGGIAINDGHTDFRSTFREMGVPDNWIMVIEPNRSEIMRGMRATSMTVDHTVIEGDFARTRRNGFTQQGDDAAIEPPQIRPQDANTNRAEPDNLAQMMAPAEASGHAGNWQPVDRSPFAAFKFYPEIGGGEYILRFPDGVSTMIIGRKSDDRGLKDKDALLVEVIDPQNNVSRRHIKIERTRGLRGAFLGLFGKSPEYRITILDKINEADRPFVAVNGKLMDGNSITINEGDMIALSADVKFRLGLPKGL